MVMANITLQRGEAIFKKNFTQQLRGRLLEDRFLLCLYTKEKKMRKKKAGGGGLKLALLVGRNITT